MKSLISSLIGLVLNVSAGAEPLLEGRVRLESGEPVADAQVRIFDLSDLRQGPMARAQTDGTGYFALPLAALTGSVLPTRFTLGQNYPNPFNPSTIIPYHLAALSEVRLEVFNLLGQHIATLVDGERSAGFHTATWHATDAAGRAVGAGVYVYRMTVGVESQTGRMVLIDGQAGVSAGGIASVWPGASGGSGSDGGDAQVYGLVVSGSGLTPYVDSAFRVEAGMAPVELVVSAGLPSAGKATDDDCAFCYLFNTQQEEGDDGQEAIPDAKLRAAIAAALGKASGATITKGEMETLRRLEANEAGISDLTGLEFATNLRELSLNGNEITDLSALAGLTKLEVLDLSGNQITDISALADLTKLWWLGLDGLSGNQITGISALAGLTNLRVLYIGNNQITDVSALAGLTKLTHLYLWNNRITDVSALAGLTKLIELFLNDNPLSASSINDHIPILQARGVAVTFDPTPVTVTDDSTPVTIPDVNLRAAIEAALGKASGETITKGEMSTLVRLRAKDASIRDLTGLEFATNLGDLKLYDNNLTDVSALAGLTKLEKLGLDGNGITDISALAGLTNLKELYLSGNQITDIAALSGLTKLTELNLWNNRITDVSALAGLTKLKKLELRQNPLSASSIDDHISALQARGVTVTFDPTPVAPTLVTIPDVNLRAAIAAALGKARGETITKGEMETLLRLDAEDAGISNLTGLEFATNLGDLKLYDNNLTDVSALRGLTNLTVLRLGHNNITDVSALRGLTKLTQLELDFNNVSDLSPLSGLTNLTVLGLGHNNITDVSALQGLTKLRSLGLWQNNITDVSALRGLVNLIWLELDYNSITDVSALKGLTKLKNLGLANNPLSASSINDHIPALQARGVTVAFDPTLGPVTIPDVNLRAAIEAALDKASGGPITVADMATLTRFVARNKGIRSLTGLEFATNLTLLDLGEEDGEDGERINSNNISNLSPLSGLTNLTTLGLGYNSITDVSALSGLTNLTWLGLGYNSIIDLSALQGLTKLTYLVLDFNSITDLSALQGLTKLGTLFLQANSITDVSALQGLTNLRDLFLNHNNIADVSALSGLTRLTRLTLSFNSITDVSTLSGLTRLTRLELYSNNITEVSALAGLTRLTGLDLRQNPLNTSSINEHIPALQDRGVRVWFDPRPISDDPTPVTIPDASLRAAIEAALGKARGETITRGEMSILLRLDADDAGISDLTGLEFATNLTRLYLNNNQITDVSALAGLTNLTELYLWGNQITDVSALAGLTKLEFLNLSNNQITDVSALARLTNLTELYLSNNQITDVSALAGLTKLEFLNLSNNQITDVSALAGLTKLEALQLAGNQITDVSALARLTNLTYLHLWGNQITDVSALAGLTNLKELYLRQNPLSASSINNHIPVFQARRVTVTFDPLPAPTITAATTDDPTPVTIPDAKLRAAIEATLSKARGTTITKGEMSTLLRLNVAYAGINNLTGLEFAVNLNWSNLSGNNISDISPLSGLNNLTELKLRQNPLSASSINDHIPALQARGVTVSFNPTPVTITDDPTPVTITDVNLRAAIEAALGKASGATITKGEMSRLFRMEASDAGIRDLTGLEFATNLTYLKLDGNTFRDGSALRGLTALSGLTNLIELDLSGNHLTNISALSGLTNLTNLSLIQNNISDISPLRELTNLTYLNLDRNNISDISPLRELTNLTYLNLDRNNISDISLLRELTNLRRLSFHYNNVSDVSPLRGLTNLTELNFNGNNASDISALSGLTNLTWLQIWLNNISDISALSGMTYLKTLYLHHNNVSDISALSGLTNLKTLGLLENNISDVSPLRGLTNLTFLALAYNNISDVSPLRGLTKLEALQLTYNNISDVSPLRGLTNLTFLTLAYNNISDVSPLRGLTKLETLQLASNPLNASSINDHIPALQSSGATVSFDPFYGGDFDIELVFLDQFTGAQKNVLRAVARRWMSVITKDLPDYEFTQGWSGECGDQSFEIPAGERIDDLRIYVTSFEGDSAVGWGGPHLLREATHLPVLGCMGFDLERANLIITGLHEIGHVLGFGTIWDDLGFFQRPNADTHFNGPRAIAAFNDAGGRDYTGAKVPVEKMDGVHWRSSVFRGELMRPGGGRALSAITVQSLADLGYGVDVTQAASYTLPGTAGKISAKIVAAIPSPHGQGRIAEGLPLMSGDDHLGSRQESTYHGFDFDLRDNRLMGRLAPHPQAEPKPLCGLHLRQEPMYVVDQQGYIIRTIGR